MPHIAILPYVAARGSKGAPLFRFQDGSFLTHDTFVKDVRHLLKPQLSHWGSDDSGTSRNGCSPDPNTG